MTDAELIRRIDEADGDVRGRALEFIEGQIEILERVGDTRFSLSVKQREWAEDILERVDG